MTIHNLVEGYIDFFDANKKFGFIIAGRERVFFHLSACREVEGTPESPVLTDRPDPRVPRWYRGTRRIERVVLVVTQSDKGAKALAWGYKPTRTWVENLAHTGLLSEYLGGELTLLYRRRPHDHPHRTVTARLVEQPQLISGDPWQLKLTYDVYGSVFGPHSRPTDRCMLVLDLGRGQAYPDHKSSYGRFAMEVSVRGEWIRMIFFPPNEGERLYGWINS